MWKSKITLGLIVVLLCVPGLKAVAEGYSTLVFEAQERLKELGYDPGVSDGHWGKRTSSAVREFQDDSAIPITGKLDEETLKALGIEKLEEPDCATVIVLNSVFHSINDKEIKVGDDEVRSFRITRNTRLRDFHRKAVSIDEFRRCGKGSAVTVTRCPDSDIAISIEQGSSLVSFGF